MEILTPKQAAELLQLHEETVRNWLRAGTLPGVRIGRAWRVRRADLDKLFEKGGGKRGSGRKKAEVAAPPSSVGSPEAKAGASADAAVSEAVTTKQVSKRGRKRAATESEGSP